MPFCPHCGKEVRSTAILCPNCGKRREVCLEVFALRSIKDIPKIQKSVTNRTIMILKLAALAQKDMDELKTTVEELYHFASSVGGEMARLGNDKLVITPPGIQMWRGLHS